MRCTNVENQSNCKYECVTQMRGRSEHFQVEIDFTRKRLAASQIKILSFTKNKETIRRDQYKLWRQGSLVENSQEFDVLFYMLD